MSQLPTVESGNQAVRKSASEYQREFRKRIEGKVCDCGLPAIKFKITGFICARCEYLENEMALGYRCGNRAMQSEAQFKPLEELSAFSIAQINRRSKAEISAMNDRGENRFTASVKEVGQELVVIAHGEYHLKAA